MTRFATQWHVLSFLTLVLGRKSWLGTVPCARALTPHPAVTGVGAGLHRLSFSEAVRLATVGVELGVTDVILPATLDLGGVNGAWGTERSSDPETLNDDWSMTNSSAHVSARVNAAASQLLLNGQQAWAYLSANHWPDPSTPQVTANVVWGLGASGGRLWLDASSGAEWPAIAALLQAIARDHSNTAFPQDVRVLHIQDASLYAAAAEAEAAAAVSPLVALPTWVLRGPIQRLTQTQPIQAAWEWATASPGAIVAGDWLFRVWLDLGGSTAVQNNIYAHEHAALALVRAMKFRSACAVHEPVAQANLIQRPSNLLADSVRVPRSFDSPISHTTDMPATSPVRVIARGDCGLFVLRRAFSNVCVLHTRTPPTAACDLTVATRTEIRGFFPTALNFFQTRLTVATGGVAYGILKSSEWAIYSLAATTIASGSDAELTVLAWEDASTCSLGPLQDFSGASLVGVTQLFPQVTQSQAWAWRTDAYPALGDLWLADSCSDPEAPRWINVAALAPLHNPLTLPRIQWLLENHPPAQLASLNCVQVATADERQLCSQRIAQHVPSTTLPFGVAVVANSTWRSLTQKLAAATATAVTQTLQNLPPSAPCANSADQPSSSISSAASRRSLGRELSVAIALYVLVVGGALGLAFV